MVSFLPYWDSEGETDLVGEGVYGHAKSPCETKVTQFEFSFLVDKQVLGFEVTVQDSILVAEGCSFEKLVHKTANGDWVESATVSVSVHILLEVPFTEFEDENEFGFCVYDVVEADDVHVLELLHERDLADSCGRGSLFSIEMNFFECNDLVGCS